MARSFLGAVARPVLETALLVAAEAQQHLAEHQQRIAALERLLNAAVMP